MKNAGQGSATRKPPEPAGTHTEVDDWIRRVMVTALEGAKEPRMREWIEEAARVPGWK